MHWKKWLKTAMLNQLRIKNWPNGVPAPGPNFNLKKLSAHALGVLVGGYIQNQENNDSSNIVPDIVRWTEGKNYNIKFCSL
jgi:hypothetical protein